MNYYKTNLDGIIEWCKANNQVEWLKKAAAKTIPTETGSRKITFIELKREFFLTFMADKVPVAKKEKQPTMWDKINSL